MHEYLTPVDLGHCYRMLNHGPVVLISVRHGCHSNVMPVAWTTPLDFDPPKIIVILDKQSFTRKLLEASGELAISIPQRKIADQVLLAGSLTGHDGDKFERTGLDYFQATASGAPLIKDCAGWFECRLIPEPDNQERYDLFIVEVIAAWSDRRVFSEGRWHFDNDSDRTIHYQSGGAFFMTGDTFLCEEKEGPGGS